MLECKDLTKRYGAFTALNNVNVRLHAGRITGLLGPNGAGKTTFLKLVNSLLVPTGGEVLIAGEKPGVKSREIIAYLPDRVALDPWMTLGDAVRFHKEFYGDFQEQRAREMLSTLEIRDKQRLKTLSKGTLEKVQLMLVMARDAKLFLLDEPFGGVDPAARDAIIDTILANYKRSAALLISTHLIQDVERILDDVLFLKKGEIVLQGTAQEIRAEKGMTIDALFREMFR